MCLFVTSPIRVCVCVFRTQRIGICCFADARVRTRNVPDSGPTKDGWSSSLALAMRAKAWPIGSSGPTACQSAWQSIGRAFGAPCAVGAGRRSDVRLCGQEDGARDPSLVNDASESLRKVATEIDRKRIKEPGGLWSTGGRKGDSPSVWASGKRSRFISRDGVAHRISIEGLGKLEHRTNARSRVLRIWLESASRCSESKIIGPTRASLQRRRPIPRGPDSGRRASRALNPGPSRSKQQNMTPVLIQCRALELGPVFRGPNLVSVLGGMGSQDIPNSNAPMDADTWVGGRIAWPCRLGGFAIP